MGKLYDTVVRGIDIFHDPAIQGPGPAVVPEYRPRGQHDQRVFPDMGPAGGGAGRRAAGHGAAELAALDHVVVPAGDRVACGRDKVGQGHERVALFCFGQQGFGLLEGEDLEPARPGAGIGAKPLHGKVFQPRQDLVLVARVKEPEPDIDPGLPAVAGFVMVVEPAFQAAAREAVHGGAHHGLLLHHGVEPGLDHVDPAGRGRAGLPGLSCR